MFNGSKLIIAAATSLGLAAVSTVSVAAPTCPNVGFAIVEPTAGPNTRPLKNDNNETLFVRKDLLTTTADLAELKVGKDLDEQIVLYKLKPAAATRLQEATTNHSGIRIAFLADDKIVMAVTWTGPYGMEPAGTQLAWNKGPFRAEALVESVWPCIGGSGD